MALVEQGVTFRFRTAAEVAVRGFCLRVAEPLLRAAWMAKPGRAESLLGREVAGGRFFIRELRAPSR